MKKIYIKTQELDLFGENISSELLYVVFIGIQNEGCNYLYFRDMIKRDDDLPMLEQIIELLNQHNEDEDYIGVNYNNDTHYCECCGSYDESTYVYCNKDGDEVECGMDTHFGNNYNWELEDGVINFLEKSGYKVVVIKEDEDVNNV